MPHRIYVTKPIPEQGLEPLRRLPAAEVIVGPADDAVTTEVLLTRTPGCTGLICFVGDPINAAVLEAAAPTCRIVANYGVGTDNIDLAAATRLGIMVTNTPDVLTEATADLALALILAVARQLLPAARWAASGTWPGIAPMQIFGHDVHGKTLGIVGAGRIGTAVARRGHAFDMPLIYTSRRANPTLDAMGARRCPLAELATAADFVSLHAPLTPETRGMIDASFLARMKPTAYLVNTARGALVDENALIEALAHDRIAGAGLDVYSDEPHIPPALLNLPGVVCLPHVGSATLETRVRMAQRVAENMTAALNNQRPPNLVNQVTTP